MKRLCNGTFFAFQDVTIGVDFYMKTVKTVKMGYQVKLLILDTAGQVLFRKIISVYFRGMNAVLFIYDISRAETFEQLPELLRLSKQNSKHNVRRFLVGNKCDLSESRRQVTYDMAHSFAQQNNITFIGEASAKENENVEKIFDEILASEQQQQQQHQQEVQINSSHQIESLSSSSCYLL